jgi:hypothetical protein
MRAMSDTYAGVGRRRRWDENMQARFKSGTFARISKVLTEAEDRTDLVRAAVEAELRRREAKQKRRKQ